MDGLARFVFIVLYLSAGAERKLCKLALANVVRLVKHWARVSEAASSVCLSGYKIARAGC